MNVSKMCLFVFAVLRSSSSMLHLINQAAKAAVRVGLERGEWFNISVGSRQGDPISPVTFLAYL